MLELLTECFQAPTVAYGSTTSSGRWAGDYTLEVAGLSRPLPPAIHMQSLQPVDGGVVLRLRHIYDIGEHPTLSQVGSPFSHIIVGFHNLLSRCLLTAL